MRSFVVARWRGAALVLALVLGLAIAGTTPASAAGASVSVSPATIPAGQPATLTLAGSGFQSIVNGFGGIYVFFGVVRGAWQPSKGGASGLNYLYIPDSETKDNHGYQRFVAYPGDPTAYAANGGTLATDGTWHATLSLPGSQFTATGRDGNSVQVDCLREQCGVITIGAHGVVSADNETFTPVTFALTANAPAPAQPTATPRRVPSTPAATTQPVGRSTPTSQPTPPPTITAAPTAPSTIAPTVAPTASPAQQSPVTTRLAGTSAQSPSGWLPWTLTALVLLAAAAGGGLFWWRRRSGTST